MHNERRAQVSSPSSDWTQSGVCVCKHAVPGGTDGETEGRWQCTGEPRVLHKAPDVTRLYLGGSVVLLSSCQSFQSLIRTLTQAQTTRHDIDVDHWNHNQQHSAVHCVSSHKKIFVAFISLHYQRTGHLICLLCGSLRSCNFLLPPVSFFGALRS